MFYTSQMGDLRASKRAEEAAERLQDADNRIGKSMEEESLVFGVERMEETEKRTNKTEKEEEKADNDDFKSIENGYGDLMVYEGDRLEEDTHDDMGIDDEEDAYEDCKRMITPYEDLMVYDDRRIDEDLKRVKANVDRFRGNKMTVTRPASSFTNWMNNLKNLRTLVWIFSTFFSTKLSFSHLYKIYKMMKDYLNPTIRVSIHEFERGYRNSFYSFTERYLCESASLKASKLRANGERTYDVALTIDEGQYIKDEFNGVEFTWGYHCTRSETNRTTKYYYTLSFDRKYRDLVLEQYFKHVVETSRALNVKNRKRKLYTNSIKENTWSWVEFNHPANFKNLAMDKSKKKEIMDDLESFSQSKDYFTKTGKAWKRGYLLYGPPGTGKSTMIASMANFLEYDIYDLELTSVKNNSSLRTLLSNTNNKSILVIEDIDCSLDIAGKRNTEEKKEKTKQVSKDGASVTGSKASAVAAVPPALDPSTVTLSGLLNFIDGLWSSIGEERLVVFTTNHVEKLDPALIRRGRMDMHIELSYCTYEAFEVLAENYLEIDSHPLFFEVRELLETRNITPADVAEALTCSKTSSSIASQVTQRLEELIGVLQKIPIKPQDKEKGEEEAPSIEFILA